MSNKNQKSQRRVQAIYKKKDKECISVVETIPENQNKSQKKEIQLTKV